MPVPCVFDLFFDCVCVQMFSCFNACRIRTKLSPAQCIKEVNKLKVKGRCSPKVDGITFRLCSSRCEKVRDWGVDRATAGCKFVSSTRPSPPTQKPTGAPTMSPTVSTSAANILQHLSEQGAVTLVSSALNHTRANTAQTCCAFHKE